MPVTRHDTSYRKRRKSQQNPTGLIPSPTFTQNLNKTVSQKPKKTDTSFASAPLIQPTVSQRSILGSYVSSKLQNNHSSLSSFNPSRSVASLGSFFSTSQKTLPPYTSAALALQFPIPAPRETPRIGDLTPKPPEGIKEQSNAPTTRAVDPRLSAYNLTAITASAINRFKLDYHRIGDARAFGQRWSSPEIFPKEQRRTGRGPDVIGSITDTVGLAVTEGVYVPTLQKRIAEAKEVGDTQTAERLNRSLIYARLGTVSTLASMGPTFWVWQDKHMKYSRLPRFGTTFLKSAVMLDGIQEDLKNGQLNDRSAAAYTVSALARMTLSGARLMPAKKRFKTVERITNVAYLADAGIALIENAAILGTRALYGSAYPLDLWADGYKRLAPQSLDSSVVKVGQAVNKGMAALGMHNDSSLARKLSGVLTYNVTQAPRDVGRLLKTASPFSPN